MTKAMLSDIFDDVDCLLSDLPLESLKNLHGLVLGVLLQIKHKEVLPRELSIKEHPILDPGDLPFAVMLGIQDELFSAFL